MNKRVTLLLWAHNPRFRYQDIIVGDAFLVGPVGTYSTDTSAPDEYVERLFEARQFRVEVQLRPLPATATADSRPSGGELADTRWT